MQKKSQALVPADYIDLDRRFVDCAGSETGAREQSLRDLGPFTEARAWEDILAQPCTVIIAEAGNGKTEELRHQAGTLRARGEAAFFCNLSLLATLPLHQALEVGTVAELTTWQHGIEPGFFFLDAVDEAKLVGARDFEVAIAHYLEAVEAHKGRVTTIISTRPNAWRAYADRDMLAARLGLPAPGRIADADTTMREQGALPSTTEAKTEATSEAPPPIAVMQLAPLDESRVRTFALARGIAGGDLDAFITAIERADADLFATRPADLPALIEIWKAEGRIGSYSEVVRRNIELKLDEINSVHLRASPIAKDRAVAGAEMLAAAATFGKRTSILVPDQPISQELRAQALDPANVLREWTPDEIDALLGRALFDESLYGTVRFHHSTAGEHLTANWLKQCLKCRKSRRSIEALLFARPYGTGELVVVPSLKPILGWLAGWDQRIRDVTLRVDPKVLLEYGDSTALDIDTRGRLLSQFARRYADRKHTPLSLNIREVRRIADQQLAPQLRELLSQYRQHHDVRRLVLRIIREGGITGCGDVVLPFALDAIMDVYTRAYAVQAIGAAGTLDQKQQLAAALAAAADTLDAEVLGAAIEKLWPEALSIEHIVSILENAAAPEQYSSTALEAELARLAHRLHRFEDRISLLRATVALLKCEPLHGEYEPISQRYDWLLPLASELAHSLTGEAPLEPAVLTTLALAVRGRDLNRYVGDVDQKARQLLADNQSIRHQLFWHLIEEERARSGKDITELWFPRMMPEATEFDAKDFDHFLEAITSRPAMGDKRVALLVAARIWVREGRAPELTARLERAVADDDILTAQLKQHLCPPTLSAELTDSRRRRAAIEERSKREQQSREADRATWIERLRADPTQIGNLSIAADGKVWNNTLWLADEIRKKHQQPSRWTIERWELLEADFGIVVAHAFRDFCKAFWRHYRPQVRSEIGRDTSSVPWPVIIGLSGIAMEARQDPGWATKLSADEAALAARYALWELNGLPPWFRSLWSARSDPVSEVLLKELRWELGTPREQAGSGYVLAKLRWGDEELAQALRPKIIRLVEQSKRAESTTLAEAVTLILRDERPLPATFANLIRSHAKATKDDAHKALWLAAGLCVDAPATLTLLEQWVGSDATLVNGEQHLTRVLEHLWGNRFDSFASAHKDYSKPGILVRLLKLTHRHVRVEDDTRAGGLVTSRHVAQDARRDILELLLSIPGEQTYQALLELADFHAVGYWKDRILALAERHAESDVERPAWPEGDIAQFADEAEREPATEAELFRLGLSRLDDLKLDLEDGDESEASLLRKVHDEPELRRAIAHRLRQNANFMYMTGSEEELADKSRTDIRLHHQRVKERVPIEIKIAGKWTFEKLKERLVNQLAGQYLRAARQGIFLVVNCGRERDRKSWKVSNRSVDFAELIEALKIEAARLLVGAAYIEGLEVVGIDLVRRNERADTALCQAAPKRQGLKAAKKATRSAKRA